MLVIAANRSFELATIATPDPSEIPAGCQCSMTWARCSTRWSSMRWRSAGRADPRDLARAAVAQEMRPLQLAADAFMIANRAS